MSHTPRKRFGQNFLIDNNIIDQIISAIDPRPKQHFLEIGPGSGALTKGLIASGAIIDAVEIDRDLAAFLQQEYGTASNFNLHIGDILKFPIHDLGIKLRGDKLRVVGNLPYNISTPLLFKLFMQIPQIADMTFMLQHEVALRLTAQPGTKEYGRLSVMAQYYCDISMHIAVPASAFNPPPKVESNIVRFVPHAQPRMQAQNLEILQNVVTQAFSQRRKTIHNSLKSLLDASAWQALNIDPQLRAENLTLEK